MRSVFADSGYWIAVLSGRDSLHEIAQATTESLGKRQIVTCEMVVTEVLNHFAGQGARLRQAVVDFVADIRADTGIILIPQTPELFDAALSHYAERPDKAWSLTDCASFVICERRGITEALAHDVHFQQAGITPLLRATGH